MPPAEDPGVNAPPADPSANQPPVGDDVTSTGKDAGQTVPFSRFQAVNDKAKAAEERATQFEQELASLKEQQSKPTDEDIEPDTLDLIRRSAAKLGFVSKDDLQAQETRIQVQSDISELTTKYKESGIPFDGKAIIDYAKTNGMQITSKRSLDAIYKEMNYDAIIEAQRKAAVTAFQESASGGAEKPGSKGTQPPAEPKPASIRDRIRLAREKAGISI